MRFQTPCTMQKEVKSSMFSSVHSFSRVCNPMNRSTPCLPVHHHLPGFTQTHVHWVTDAIQPSHPLSSPFPPAPNPSQDQSLLDTSGNFLCDTLSNHLAAAAKSLQSCPTLSDPTDSSLPGSSVHGIFQARVLEWGAVQIYYLGNHDTFPIFQKYHD